MPSTENFFRACLLFPASLLAATVPDGRSDLTQLLVCAETEFSRAAERRDLPAFLRFVDPDARFANNIVARGKEEIAAAWGAVFRSDGPAMRWRPAITEVSADGRLGLSRGPYRSLRTGENGEITVSWGHFISTWRRNDDGDWRVMFDSGGDDGMTPSAAEIELLNSEPSCP
ncbi:MAG: nuclear transport factor 2 family protein [Gammaproteobacteria bacterium]|nr:nuclear transport factor 2 family protein [Gammaproteobacteria bacterium]